MLHQKFIFSTELFPVPHNSSLEAEDQVGATTVTSQTLKDFINANTVANDEIEDKVSDDTKTDAKNDTANNTASNSTNNSANSSTKSAEAVLTR